MKAEKRPYELLARWGPDGAVQGAHVQWATVVIDNADAIVEWHPGKVEPVHIGKGNGYPLADILATAASDALISLMMEKQKVAALEEKMVGMLPVTQTSPAGLGGALGGT